MIKAAMVGLGWWGRTIVESVQSDSDVIRFVAGATRTKSPEVTAFAEWEDESAPYRLPRRDSIARTLLDAWVAESR